MRQSRRPKLGDMLIVYPDGRARARGTCGDNYVGIVHKIEFDKWGHSQNVFVAWQGSPPQMYNRTHGYAGTNIHNLRSEFRVIRKGVEIP